MGIPRHTGLYTLPFLNTRKLDSSQQPSQAPTASWTKDGQHLSLSPALASTTQSCTSTSTSQLEERPAAETRPPCPVEATLAKVAPERYQEAFVSSHALVAPRRLALPNVRTVTGSLTQNAPPKSCATFPQPGNSTQSRTPLYPDLDAVSPPRSARAAITDAPLTTQNKELAPSYAKTKEARRGFGKRSDRQAASKMGSPPRLLVAKEKESRVPTNFRRKSKPSRRTALRWAETRQASRNGSQMPKSFNTTSSK